MLPSVCGYDGKTVEMLLACLSTKPYRSCSSPFICLWRDDNARLLSVPVAVQVLLWRQRVQARQESWRACTLCLCLILSTRNLGRYWADVEADLDAGPAISDYTGE